ncbi:NAD-dependent epimerase/dehydratase family protein [Paenibacillus marinisediminis]
MKALVTGGAGFIGSHLVEQLVADGFRVSVIDNLQSGGVSYLHPEAVLYEEDIRSDRIIDIIVREEPDYVFHLAAQADVQQSMDDPRYDADVNIIGTVNVLKACQQAFVKKLIFSSTSGVYGNLQKERIFEEDPANPISYYGLSKRTAEIYLQFACILRGLPFTILRYSNVYGPRQTPKGEGGVIAVFIEKIKHGLPINIYGDGSQTRDFVFVKDVVHANIAAIKLGHGETIHVSTGNSISINELVTMLKQIHTSEIRAHYLSARDGDIIHSCLDCDKAYRLLNWQSKVDMMKGLLKTYSQYRGKPCL